MRASRRSGLRLVAAALGCTLLAGCHVTSAKNGNHDDVDIGTPFGNMQVKTKDATDTTAIGLSAYPGALPLKDDGKDSSAADVNMSFGSFHLGVKAASFQTPDPPEKVLAFYRRDLARYGDVIECRGDQPVGSPTRTAQGLSCDHREHFTTGDAHGLSATGDQGLELRAGSEQHQHIVSADPRNGGTKIALVMLDLPGHLEHHEQKDVE